jgi:hypothetical protein
VALNALKAGLRDRLGIDDLRYVEIESKKRVLPEQVKDLKKYLLKRKKVRHQKAAFFFDQFLDTPGMDIFKRGASLRLRYKGNGSKIYLQYKGPGFIEDGLLYRSEFSSRKLRHVFLEESHHDVIHFSKTSVKQILSRHVEPAMARAMRRHLGAKIIPHITTGPIISMYQKDKFLVDLDSAFLEPSLDRVFAFHIDRSGIHPLSTFCEYENEIKARNESFDAKIGHLSALTDFDEAVAEKFSLPAEKLDKYHRCTSIFLPHRR